MNIISSIVSWFELFVDKYNTELLAASTFGVGGFYLKWWWEFKEKNKANSAKKIQNARTALMNHRSVPIKYAVLDPTKVRDDELAHIYNTLDKDLSWKEKRSAIISVALELSQFNRPRVEHLMKSFDDWHGRTV